MLMNQPRRTTLLAFVACATAACAAPAEEGEAPSAIEEEAAEIGASIGVDDGEMPEEMRAELARTEACLREHGIEPPTGATFHVRLKRPPEGAEDVEGVEEARDDVVFIAKQDGDGDGPSDAELEAMLACLPEPRAGADGVVPRRVRVIKPHPREAPVEE
jgi:hypothetical protein